MIQETVPNHVVSAFQGEPGVPEPAGHAWTTAGGSEQ